MVYGIVGGVTILSAGILWEVVSWIWVLLFGAVIMAVIRFWPQILRLKAKIKLSEKLKLEKLKFLLKPRFALYLVLFGIAVFLWTSYESKVAPTKWTYHDLGWQSLKNAPDEPGIWRVHAEGFIKQVFQNCGRDNCPDHKKGVRAVYRRYMPPEGKYLEDEEGLIRDPSYQWMLPVPDARLGSLIFRQGRSGVPFSYANPDSREFVVEHPGDMWFSSNMPQDKEGNFLYSKKGSGWSIRFEKVSDL